MYVSKHTHKADHRYPWIGGTYELLRLTHKGKDHEPSDQVETGIEPKCSRWRHDGLHTRKRQAQDTSECVVDAHGPGHTLLTVDRGKYLGTVLECHRSFAKRVHDGEQVHEQHHRSDSRAAAKGRIVIE